MYAFVAITYVLSDVIPIMERLNLTFQKECVNLSTLEPMVESTKHTLRTLLQTPGQHEQGFNTRGNNNTFEGITLTHGDRGAQQTVQTVRNSFIQQLIDSLSERFPSDQVTILSAFAKLFDVDRYPPRQQLDQYATAEMDKLACHYATVINGPRAQRDFTQFKATLFGYGVQDFTAACRAVINNLAMQFLDFTRLAQIALVIPVTSVPAERGFSVQNCVKTPQRNRLGEDRVGCS